MNAGLRAYVTVLAVATALALSSKAHALINPRFTPVELTRSASAVLLLELGPVDAKGQTPVRVVRALKGAAPAAGVAFDLSRTEELQAKAFREAIGNGKQMALVFIGRQRSGAGEDEEDGSDEKAFAAGAQFAAVHVDGRWFRASGNATGGWQVNASDDKLAAVWAGGTDMLARGVEYILSDRDASFPVAVGAAWSGENKIATLKGKVHAVMAVDLTGSGAISLFICCSEGDRLMRCVPGKQELRDITATAKLTSTSQCSAWADFNGDGRLDLASSDGTEIALWLQTAAGTFERKGPGKALVGCLGLSALDVGGRAGLLASTKGMPILLTPKDDGSLAASPIAADATADAKLGEAHACLIADFDDDGLADILQPLAKGSLFYKGIKPGAFAVPAACAIATGPGPAGSFVGDYDADGRLDVVIAADERCCLWRNLGGGKFADAMRYAGEAAYISKPGAIGGTTCDINNDGRQDIFILYSTQAPQIFFSRGFASFGHAHQPIDLTEINTVPAALDGQQAGLVADLNGDGGQDMALVLPNGELWVLWRDIENTPREGVRVTPVPGASAGPVMVTAVLGKRPLGALNISPGQEAFFGTSGPGECELEWRIRGKGLQRARVLVKDEPVRFVVPRQ